MTQTFERAAYAIGYRNFNSMSGEYVEPTMRDLKLIWGAAQASQREEVEQLRALVGKLVDTLEFYCSPFNRVDADGDPVSVPDFYDEMNFGDRAFEALTEAQKVMA